MKEKLIIGLLSVNIALIIYISQLPNRANFMPGGEIFIPAFAFIFWAVGHSFQKALKEVREDGQAG